LDFLDGIPVTDREDPQDVAPFVHRIVRLQAIKCSPRNDAASKPTDEMWANCPPLLLEDELRIACPGGVIGFGAEVRWVLGQLSGYQLKEERDGVACGALHLGHHRIPVYMIAHPSSRSQWPAAHAALAAVLRDRQNT
jgi:uracil-DNA glycosylase